MYRIRVAASCKTSKLGQSSSFGIFRVGMASVLAALIFSLPSLEASAKGPGTTYCFYSKCHRVNSLSETKKLVGKPIELHSSHYDFCGKDRYNPCGLTSSGEKFHPERPDNAASPIYPDGTILLVWNEVTHTALVVRINNAGPYWGNRKLDLSYAAAKKLGFARQGVAKLKTMILRAPDKPQSIYSRNRTYTPVLGYIGEYKDFKTAQRVATAIMAVEAIAGSSGALATAGVVIASRYETSETFKKRAKTEKQAKRIKTAMLATENRWPDFVRNVAAAEHKIEQVGIRNRVLARALPSAHKPRTNRVATENAEQIVKTRSNITRTARSHPIQTISNATALSAPQHVPTTARNTAVASAGDTAEPSQAQDVNNGAVQLDADATVVADSAPAIGTDIEWLKPVRPAVLILRATDVGAPTEPLWLRRGRLEAVFTLSKSRFFAHPRQAHATQAKPIHVAEVGTNYREMPIPVPQHTIRDSQQATRNVVIRIG